jgi:hypothetical protein
MTGDAVRQVFEALRPPVDLDRLGEACGVIERQRQRPLGPWVRALVLSAGPPGGADQADLVRSSLACGVPHVARSAV